MNILFLIFHGFSDSSGISKKILNQIKGLKELGHKVYVCQYSINKEKHRVRMVDNVTINDYGTGSWAAIKKGLVTLPSTDTQSIIKLTLYMCVPFIMQTLLL